MNLPVFALLAQEASESALFMPAPWFGIIMFAILMLSLLLTLAFAHKNRTPTAPAESHQGGEHH